MNLWLWFRSRILRRNPRFMTYARCSTCSQWGWVFDDTYEHEDCWYRRQTQLMC